VAFSIDGSGAFRRGNIRGSSFQSLSVVLFADHVAPDSAHGPEPLVKIFVVHDDKALARRLAVGLRLFGFEVACAHGGHEAAQSVLRYRPALILSAMNMPRYTGLELRECLQFAGHGREIPVIFLAGAENVAQRADALRQGASAVLSAPFGMRPVLRAVHSALSAKNGTHLLATPAAAVHA